MTVNARAVIWIEDRLIVARRWRQGNTVLALPGGPVQGHESTVEALRREVFEETGLHVKPDRLLYVAEFSDGFHASELELVFLVELDGPPSINGFRIVDLRGGERPEVHPPILEEIARDDAYGYRDTPRSLGELARRRLRATEDA